MGRERHIYTYHCLCSTHLLTTPYAIQRLPMRALPATDRARILPLPSLHPAQGKEEEEQAREARGHADATSFKLSDGYPSILSPSLRPQRKAHIIRREDGYEKRRLWRCARCGLGVGYEIIIDVPGSSSGYDDDTTRMATTTQSSKILYIFDESLINGDQLLHETSTQPPQSDLATATTR